MKKRHRAEACVRAIPDTACTAASQGLSMGLTVCSPMGFLVQAWAWTQTWLCYEIHGWSKLARSGERLGPFTKECGRGMKGQRDWLGPHPSGILSEALPTTEDGTRELGNSAHGHRPP